MKRLNTYRVYAVDQEEAESIDIYVNAYSAQEAVDYIRESYIGYDVIDVSKVVFSWK